jgi:penicillin-binding protein 1C
MVVKFDGGQRPFRLFVNGTPTGKATFERRFLWNAPGSGFADLMILDGKGQTSKVSIVLEATQSPEKP